MTIRREGKAPQVIHCDGCGVIFVTKLTDWRKFNYAARWNEAKAAGWTAARTATPGKSDWEHFCGECSTQDSMAVKSAQNG